ncbi:MAG: hypothetical protein AABX16_02570 [Nanoarchaeota archaeon]
MPFKEYIIVPYSTDEREALSLQMRHTRPISLELQTRFDDATNNAFKPVCDYLESQHISYTPLVKMFSIIARLSNEQAEIVRHLVKILDASEEDEIGVGDGIVDKTAYRR